MHIFASGGSGDSPGQMQLLWNFLPVFTAFGVVILGSWLNRRAQHRQWLAENQKNEFSRVLTSMTDIYSLILRNFVGKVPLGQEYTDGVLALARNINTCLFITDFLATTKLPDDLKAITQQLYAERDFEMFRAEYWKLVNRLLVEAKKIKI